MKEEDKLMENLLQEMKRGTLVLAVLINTGEASYGYSLVQILGNQGMEIEQNTLYPLLRRMEKQGLLESSWNTEENRPRKYYKISTLGEKIRDNLIDDWRRTNKTIESMMEGEDKK